MTSQALQIEKCLFPPLALDGSNYMTWMVHVEGNLMAKDLFNTVSAHFNDGENSNSRKKGAEAFIFILHHLYLSLQNQYFSIKNPSTLWKQLKARFDHQRIVLGPNTLHEWNQLRFQDFKTVVNIIPHYLVSFPNLYYAIISNQQNINYFSSLKF